MSGYYLLHIHTNLLCYTCMHNNIQTLRCYYTQKMNIILILTRLYTACICMFKLQPRHYDLAPPV